MTRADACAKARADFEAALGTILRPDFVGGFEGEDSTDASPNGTAALRVVATPQEDLEHTVDDWLDPYWNLELVEDPEHLLTRMRSLWTYGPSYQFDRP